MSRCCPPTAMRWSARGCAGSGPPVRGCRRRARWNPRPTTGPGCLSGLSDEPVQWSWPARWRPTNPRCRYPSIPPNRWCPRTPTASQPDPSPHPEPPPARQPGPHTWRSWGSSPTPLAVRTRWHAERHSMNGGYAGRTWTRASLLPHRNSGAPAPPSTRLCPYATAHCQLHPANLSPDVRFLLRWEVPAAFLSAFRPSDRSIRPAQSAFPANSDRSP